jgi:hypothetical protein
MVVMGVQVPHAGGANFQHWECQLCSRSVLDQFQEEVDRRSLDDLERRKRGDRKLVLRSFTWQRWGVGDGLVAHVVVEAGNFCVTEYVWWDIVAVQVHV